MLSTLELGKYSAISCDLGTFDEASVYNLLNIHRLSSISELVKEESKWFNKVLCSDDLPCANMKKDLETFKKLLEDTPNGHFVFDYNKTILASDIASIAGSRWVNFGILSGIVKMLNSTESCVFMLNDAMLLNKQELQKVIENVKGNPKAVIFISNVGKSKEVFLSSPSKKGCHWTLTYVDLVRNQWYYCDTLGWNAPSDLKKEIQKIVETFYREKDVPRKPFQGFTFCHIPSKTSSHVCSSRCLPNFPLQTCGNVCGIITIVLAAIAAKAPVLWKQVLLSREGTLAAWLREPSLNSDRLRATTASWLVKAMVDVNTLGISESVLESIPLTNIKTRPALKNVYIPRSIKREPGEEVPPENSSHQKKNIAKVIAENDTSVSKEEVWIHSIIEQERDVATNSKRDSDDVKDKGFQLGSPVRTDDSKGAQVKDQPQKEVNKTDGIQLAQSPIPVRSDSFTRNRETHLKNDISVPSAVSLEANTVDEDKENQVFFVGQHFTSVEQLDKTKENYEKQNFCQLWKRDVRTLEAAMKRVPKRVAMANKSLRYYSMKLSCKFGGKECKPRENAKRNTSSFRQCCPFEISLMLSKDGSALEVMKITLEHNHVISSELYNHLPRQRNVNGSLREEVKGAISLKANSKLIQQKIQTATGRPITLKDIANLKAETKKAVNPFRIIRTYLSIL